MSHFNHSNLYILHTVFVKLMKKNGSVYFWKIKIIKHTFKIFCPCI